MSDAVVVGCGIGWGVIAAAPIVGRVRRRTVVARLGASAPAPTVHTRTRRAFGPVGRVIGGLLRHRRERIVNAQLLLDLPTVLDLLGVAVGAGATPRGALETATRWGPPSIAGRLRQVLVVTELGGSFTDALRNLAQETPALASVAEVLIASAHLGAPAGGALARLGDETRSSLRRAAEARARTLPVKLLFPLVFLVLPAFGLLTVAPALLSALQRL